MNQQPFQIFGNIRTPGSALRFFRVAVMVTSLKEEVWYQWCGDKNSVDRARDWMVDKL